MSLSDWRGKDSNNIELSSMGGQNVPDRMNRLIFRARISDRLDEMTPKLLMISFIAHHLGTIPDGSLCFHADIRRVEILCFNIYSAIAMGRLKKRTLPKSLSCRIGLPYSPHSDNEVTWP